MHMKKYAAEFIGTFWLVLGGCGSAVLAAAFPEVGIGLLGVSLAFGLTVLTMAFAIGHISGCHLNPAVSIGLWAGGRFPAKDLLPYIVAQVLGGIVAGGVLYLIASGKAGLQPERGLRLERLRRAFAGRLRARRGLVSEVVMTMLFLVVILGATDTRAGRLRADRHRPVPDADPPDQHSGHEHLGQPGAQHRRGRVCGRLGRRAAVALLAGADRRRADRRGHLSGHRIGTLSSGPTCRLPLCPADRRRPGGRSGSPGRARPPVARARTARARSAAAARRRRSRCWSAW